MPPWDLFKKYCQPRWDAKEFDLIKQSTLSQILQQKQIPIALLETNKKLIYGTGSVFSEQPHWY
jgi:zinc protease